MAINAQSVVRRVVDGLQDSTSVRWTLRELVRYLNDGQREIIMYRPDAMVTNASLALTANQAKQNLPVTGAVGTKLIDIVRNTGGSKRAIRMINREILDAQFPNWQGTANTGTEILHFMYDARDPKTFYVYPPAGTGSSVEAVYAALPSEIAAPIDGAVLPADSATDTTSPTMVLGTISVPDIYANVLADYILYRAYNKDSEYAGNSARAQAYYASFANALGIEIKATIAVAPATKGSPLTTKQPVV
jgi:hypothetical protein